VCKFGGDPAICLREAICAKVYRRTDGRTDDGRRAIALAHSWNDLKTVEVRIMQFSSYSSPIPLVFAGCFIQKSDGVPPSGGVNKGWGKLPLCVNISKTEGDTSKITIND